MTILTHIVIGETTVNVISQNTASNKLMSHVNPITKNRKYFRATFRTPAPIFSSLKMTFLLFLGGFGDSKGFKCVQNIR